MVYHVTRNGIFPWPLGNKTPKNFWVTPPPLLQANIFIFSWVFEVGGQDDLAAWFPPSSFVPSLEVAGFESVKLTSAARLNFWRFWQQHQIFIDLNVLSLGHSSTIRPFWCFSMARELYLLGLGWAEIPLLHHHRSSPPQGWRTCLSHHHRDGRAAVPGPATRSTARPRGSAPPSLHPCGRQLERSALENTISIIGAEQLHQPSWQPGNIFCLNLLRGHIVSSRSSFKNPPGASEGLWAAELLVGTRGVTLRGPCPEPGAGVPATPCVHRWPGQLLCRGSPGKAGGYRTSPLA